MRKFFEDRGDELLIAILIGAQIILLFSFDYFPSQDGPEHIYNIHLFLTRILTGPNPVFDSFFAIQKLPSPNLLATVLTGGLMLIFPPLIAEKMMLGLYVLLLPLSALYALRSIDGKAGWLAILILPFSFNLFFHLGFYNFSYSLIFFFVTIGYWLRHRSNPSWKTVAGLCGLLFLVYFSHIATWVMAVAALGVLELFASLSHRKDAGQRLSMITAATLPVALLALEFLGRGDGTFAWTTSIAAAPLFLLQLVGLGSFVRAELPLAAILSLLILSVSILRWGIFLKGKDARVMLPWVILFGIFALIYIVAPSSAAGGAYLQHRLILFPFFALILAAATAPFSFSMKRTIQGIATVITVGFIAVHGHSYAMLNTGLKEYISGASFIEPGSTVLPLTFTQKGDNRFQALNVRPFLHSASILALQSRSINLLNYEAHKNHFILRFHPGEDPFVLMDCEGGLEGTPPCARIGRYEETTGHTVDYVLIWNLAEQYLGKPATNIILSELEGYELIGRSAPKGLLLVYRKKQ